MAGCEELAHFFTAADLERALCGSPALDLRELQKAAEYEDGYSDRSPVIKWCAMQLFALF